MPGAGFQKVASRWKQVANDMRELPYAVLKRNYVSIKPELNKRIIDNIQRSHQAAGNARLSFGSQCLQDMDTNDDTESQESIIRDTAGAMYLGRSLHNNRCACLHKSA